MAEPIAYLWQNGQPLEDGCFQFYPTADRAEAEIAYCGGWSTPVFESGVDDGFAPKGGDLFRVFDGLDKHRPTARLNVGPARASAIRGYMQAECTDRYPPRHPGPANTVRS